MKGKTLKRMGGLIALLVSVSTNHVQAQTNMTGNQVLAKILSETNTTPLGLYPPEEFDWLEALGDNPLPESSGPARPVRDVPLDPLISVEGGGGRFAMSRPNPNDPAPSYEFVIVDLGIIVGDSSQATGINNNGQVTGTAGVNSGAGAFRYDSTSGAIINPGTLGGSASDAFAINASGKVVGFSQTGSGNVYHAFLYDGSMHDLDTLHLNGASSTSAANAVNASGQVVGLSDGHAFLYSGSSMIDLGTFPGNTGPVNANAFAIDDSGDIAGGATTGGYTHAFLMEGGVMLDIGTLGGNSSGANGINMYAEVVGSADTTSSGDPHAFFYDTSMQDLGVLSGETSSYALAVNNAAHVVGSSGNRAFIVSGGSMKDLNDLVINGSGWILNNALAINDKEQIVGVGVVSGHTHAFLLNPLPQGALQASGNLSPAQLTFANGPIKDPNKSGLIVITHGWQPLAPDVGWMDTMAGSIGTHLQGNINWQIYEYNWYQNAHRPNPSDALNNAAQEGKNLGNSIVAQGWTHVHFIAHSAGAALIQSATDAIKNPTTGAPNIVVHETFLDPFVGDKLQGVTSYGMNANWADQYFTRDKETEYDPYAYLFSTAPYTESPLNHSYNVEITYLGSVKVNHIKYVSSPDGIPVAEVCTDTETSHEWPINFYENTITGTGVTSDYNGFGFPLSEEGGNWNATSGYAAGNGTEVNPSTPVTKLGTPDSCTPIATPSLPPYPGIAPDFTQLPSIESTTGTIQKYVDHINLLSGSPAWISTVVTPTNPVNYIAFDAKFTSGSGAQGVLTVLWDTNEIGTLDERVIDPGLQHYQFRFPQVSSLTPHVLGFRLDPFTNIQSTVTLTNMTLNQVGVSHPPTLSVTTNTINGLQVWRLDGDLGVNYGIQATSGLGSTNWADIAVLVNTNGTVFFLDQDQTNYNQRFYRAVAP
jgi:probable HAF family extracellular repeat protein